MTRPIKWTRARARVRGLYWCWDDFSTTAYNTMPFPCFLLANRPPPVLWRSTQPIWRGEPPQPPPAPRKAAKR